MLRSSPLVAAVVASGLLACAPPPEPVVPPVTASTTLGPPLEAVGRSSPIDDVLAGVRVVSPTERIVTRHAVDVFLAHMESLLGDVRAEPVTANGKTMGVRLFGVSPRNVAGAVGLENGDQLVGIDGKSLFDQGEGLGELLDRLKRAFGSNEIELDVVHPGPPTKLPIHVNAARG